MRLGLKEGTSARLLIYVFILCAVFIVTALWLRSLEPPKRQMCVSVTGHKYLPCPKSE